MNIEFENTFIKNFFDKEYCGRLQHELSSPKKRARFFSRIAHQCETYLKHRCIAEKGDMLLPKSTICRYMATKECYVIAYNDEDDGRSVSFEAALDRLWSNGSPYILISPSCDCAYIETEYDFSEHRAYILKL